MEVKKIAIIGYGMVGGALGRYFQMIRGIEPVIYDPKKGHDSMEEVNKSDLIFICVPTPYDEEKGGFDLSFVEDSFSKIEGDKTIVVKSTVLPGTTEKFQERYPQHRLAFNPEFLTEATADHDMQNPDRQIVGYTSRSQHIAGDIMRFLPVAPFQRYMPATEAEMVKYFGNTMYSTKVVFANQIYDLCQKLGVDYDKIKDAVAADKMIGPSHLEVFHKGYRGYGGKCLPKDTRALIQLDKRLGSEMELLKKVEEINNELVDEAKKEW